MKQYRPPLPLRPATVQTGLAAMGLGIKKRGALLPESGMDILDLPGGIKLTCVRDHHDDAPASAVLLHGWEGSHQSSYMVRMAASLYERGLSVTRLNLRDHAGSHHLNPGLFYATLLDEVVAAVRLLCGEVAPRPVILIGFSLGGNYVMRVTSAMGEQTPENLAAGYAISPAIVPETSTRAIAQSRLIERYFLKKWRASLTAKQAHFPDMYAFDDIIALTSIWEMTERLLDRYSDYGGPSDYFAGYQIYPDHLDRIHVPVTVLAAKDDPVCPTDDLIVLGEHETIRRILTRHGGHNGFFDSLFGPTWYERLILTDLEKQELIAGETAPRS